MIVSTGGLGIGQYLIALADPNSFGLFVVSSVLVSMSLVPVTLVATTNPPVVVLPDKFSVRELVRVVPTGALGAFMGGASVGILLGLGAVYATAIELSLQRTAFFLAAPTIGAILFQWPIGRLSDKISRRIVMFAVALTGAATAATLMVLPAQSQLVLLFMVLLGGTIFPLYSLVVSYTIDWVPDGKATGAAATLIGVNGAGALLGPLVAAPLMAAFGPKWFFSSITAMFGVIVGYLAWRLAFKEPMPRERQKQFVPFPARAGSFAVGLVVKPVRRATQIATGRNVSSRRQFPVDIARHPASVIEDLEVAPSEILDGPVTVSPLDGD
jgi:hypothetical protein